MFPLRVAVALSWLVLRMRSQLAELRLSTNGGLTFRDRLRARIGQFDIVGVSVTDVPENFGGIWHKFVRLHVRSGSDLTFWQPFEVLSAEETTAAYWRRPWGWWSGINGKCGHKGELLGTPNTRKMRCLAWCATHIENTATATLAHVAANVRRLSGET